MDGTGSAVTRKLQGECKAPAVALRVSETREGARRHLIQPSNECASSLGQQQQNIICAEATTTTAKTRGGHRCAVVEARSHRRGQAGPGQPTRPSPRGRRACASRSQASRPRACGCRMGCRLWKGRGSAPSALAATLERSAATCFRLLSSTESTSASSRFTFSSEQSSLAIAAGCTPRAASSLALPFLLQQHKL